MNSNEGRPVRPHRSGGGQAFRQPPQKKKRNWWHIIMIAAAVLITIAWVGMGIAILFSSGGHIQ